MKKNFPAFLLRSGIAWAFLGAFMTGCSVTSDFVVVEDQTLPGLPLPLPLVGVPLVPGLSCNLPDEAALDQAVEDAIGACLAGIFTVKEATLLSLEISVNGDSPGDLSGIRRLALTLYTLDTGGLRLEQIPLGGAENPEGFGRCVELSVDPPADLLGFLRSGADCGALAIVADGQYPGQDVTFDVRARVRIRPGIRR